MCRNIFEKVQESKKTPSRFEPTRRFVCFALKGFKQYFSPFTFAEAYATLIYTIGIYLISNDRKTIKLKSVFLNPVVIAFVLGIIFNLLSLKKYVPEITNYSSYLSNLVTPLSMIIMGMKLGSIKFTSLFVEPRLYIVSLSKLIILPAVACASAFVLNLSHEIILGLFVAFAMPTAGLAPAISDKYNGDTKNAVVYTLGSTIISIVTIPACYYLLLLIT